MHTSASAVSRLSSASIAGAGARSRGAAGWHSIGLVLLTILLAFAGPSASATDFGQALSFDGVNQYVTIPHFGIIAPNTEVTVEFWARAEVLADQAAFALSPDNSANRFNGHISYHDGNTYWDYGNIVEGGRLETTSPIGSLGAWTHYAFVASQSGNFMHMYVNGVIHATTGAMNAFEAIDSELRIGGYPGGAFKGQIDEFRVWNTVRTPQEIAANYAIPLTGGEPGLVVCYHFDEGGGTTAVNSATLTASGFNGTLMNSPARLASTVLVPKITVLESVGTPLQRGGVLAWGGNGFGQTNVPAGLTDVAGVAVGWTHSVALKSDGSVLAWGDNTYGQTNVPAVLTGVAAISAGLQHSLALKTDGSVVAWGRNDYGQTDVPAGLSNVRAVDAAGLSSVALKQDGTVVAWGIANTDVSGLTGVTAIAGGGTLALRNDGTIVGAGSPALTGVVAIASDGGHNLALLSNGSVVAWGSSFYGESTVPPGLSSGIAIAAGKSQSLALNSEGSVFGWGRMNNLGDNSSHNPFWDIQSSVPSGLRGFVAVATSGYHNLAISGLTAKFAAQAIGTSSVAKTFTIKNTGGAPLHISSVSVTGGYAGEFTVDTTGMLASVPALTGETTFTVTFHPSFAGPRQTMLRVRSDDRDEGDLNILLSGTVTLPRIAIEQPPGTPLGTGSVIAWGEDDEDAGQIQLPIPLPTEVVSVATGKDHTLAIRQNGTIRVWGGLNFWGEKSTPFGISDVVAVEGGQEFSMALKSDGTVVCWGLGAEHATVVPAEATNVVNISAGSFHTLAVRKDGTILGWGADNYGELSMLPGLTGVAAAAAGVAFSVVLKTDGSVIAGGTNTSGQANVPAGLTGVTSIAAGSSHALALKNDGTVVAWGRNNIGQTNVPPGLTGVAAISAGVLHSLALKTDGSVVAWGSNNFGQADVPAGLAGVAAIAAGGNFNVALTSPTIGFGDQAVVTPSGTKTFTIRNTGNAPLHLTGVSLTGGDLNDFALTAPAMPASITPGGAATFAVTFIPGAPGVRRAMLRVRSDDLLENNIGLFFTGTGTGTLTPLQSWRLLRFGTAAGIGQAADTADPNANGILNLMEYALGGDPAGNTTGVGIVPQSSFNGTGKLQLAFIRYLDRSDITLTVQASDALTGPWTDLAQSVNGAAFTILASGATMSETGAGNSRSVIIGDLYPKTDPAHPRRFLHLKVTTP